MGNSREFMKAGGETILSQKNKTRAINLIPRFFCYNFPKKSLPIIIIIFLPLINVGNCFFFLSPGSFATPSPRPGIGRMRPGWWRSRRRGRSPGSARCRWRSGSWEKKYTNNFDFLKGNSLTCPSWSKGRAAAGCRPLSPPAVRMSNPPSWTSTCLNVPAVPKNPLMRSGALWSPCPARPGSGRSRGGTGGLQRSCRQGRGPTACMEKKSNFPHLKG